MDSRLRWDDNNLLPLEIQGAGVDAVSLAGFVLWPVFKHMAEVAFAGGTFDFSAFHTKCIVRCEYYIPLLYHVVEAGPA